MTRLDRRSVLLRYVGITMVIAAGLRAGYAAFFEPHHVAVTSNWAVEFAVGYAVFVAAYVLMPTDSVATMNGRQALSVAAQAVTGVYLVWLYPSFVVTCLLVVVAWQFALLLDFRRALLACAAQLTALAMINCTGETDASFALIIASCGGFQLFAVCAAQLARSEMAARDELGRPDGQQGDDRYLRAVCVRYCRAGRRVARWSTDHEHHLLRRQWRAAGRSLLRLQESTSLHGRPLNRSHAARFPAS